MEHHGTHKSILKITVLIRLNQILKKIKSYTKHKKCCLIVDPIKTTEDIITDDPKSMANCFENVFLKTVLKKFS